MKIAAITPVYNEEVLVEGCIRSLQSAVDEHIFLVSEKPYYGEAEEVDKTAKIASSLGATVITGEWSLDHHQRNTGIALLQDYDWIICTDVDMWLTKDNLNKLVDVLQKSSDERAYIIPQKSYWYNTDFVLDGDDFKPVIAIRPDVRFVHIGNVGTPCHILDGIICHHINWCSPKDIYKKVTTYSHAPEFDGKTWYRNYFENWDSKSGVAVLPNKTFQVSYDPLPDELKCYLK